MKDFYDRFLTWICRYSFKNPLGFVLVALLITLPAVWQLPRLGIDTDLIRLLPENNRVVRLKPQFEDIVSGSGGYFTLLLENPDKTVLMKAYLTVLDELQDFEGIGSLEYRNPRDFYSTYRYLLIPSEDLDRIVEFLIRQEAKLSPVGEDLLGDEVEEKAGREEEEDVSDWIRYIDLPEYHESEDGSVMAVKIYPAKGPTDISDSKKLLSRLESLTRRIAEEFNVWGGISGSLRNDLDQYDFTLVDLSRSGLITVVLVIVTLIIGFSSLGGLLVLLLPLALGLTWTLGLIPSLVGDLNTITSFLMLISFGLGIDFSIHLLKRFQHELLDQPPEKALLTAFLSTGKSISVSGFTTSLALFIVAFSAFRGFSEFGLVGGISIILVLLANLIFLPSLFVMGWKLRIIKGRGRGQMRWGSPGRPLTFVLALMILAAFVIGLGGLSFNYDFSDMEADIPQDQELQDRFYQVYESRRSPAAIFIARGEDTLDELLGVLENEASQQDSRIERFSSIRDFAPRHEEVQKRRILIAEIKDTVAGKWTQRVENPEHRKFIDDIKDWTAPLQFPAVEDLPVSLVERLKSMKYPDHFIVPVYIKGEKQKGRNAMAFSQELREFPASADLIGPYGETPVLADILQIVTKEGPWLMIFSFFGIFVLIFFNQRSFLETIWILMPLTCGLLLTSGLMVVFGLHLNFFNIVVIPTLIGIGVDDGVHYFRRWKENNRDTGATQNELVIPLSLTTATTIFAYLGIAFSRHPGLRSIGIVACIGLACAWLVSLFLLPGLLKIFYKNQKS
jgi:predicted RND superfamily exporter protein